MISAVKHYKKLPKAVVPLCFSFFFKIFFFLGTYLEIGEYLEQIIMREREKKKKKKRGNG